MKTLQQEIDSPNGACPTTPSAALAPPCPANYPSTHLSGPLLSALLSPETQSQPLVVIAAQPPPAPACIDLSTNPPIQLSITPPGQPPSRKIRRNGRVACLPKLQRDMVNRMIWNGVPYKNIVLALSEEDFTVTERNISNWATGGYLEWSLAQEHVLEHRLDQDHLLDFLRRDDAPELPEVGLQAAATRLSQIMLQKSLQGDTAGLDLDKTSKLVDLLCRLNRELGPLQKQREDSRRTLGREHDPVLVKDTEQLSVIDHERYYSNPPSDSDLPRPSEPPAVPPMPTASLLARQAAEERHEAQIQHRKRTTEMLGTIVAKRVPRSSQPQPASNPNSSHPSTNPPIQSSNTPPPPAPQPSTNPLIQHSPHRTPPAPAPEAVR